MTDTLTPHLDPASGNLALDDGDVAWADSAAIGCVVFTLRTQHGTCGVDPDMGVDWRAASTDTLGAPQTLRREIERALRWIAEAGLLTGLAVTCDRMAPRGIGYVVSFTANGRTRTARGSVLGSIATITPTLPTLDPLGNAEALAVARRLARFVGGALRASDGTLGAAFYLSLGAAIAATRRYTGRSLSEVFGHLSSDEAGRWEHSLGMLSGEGMPLADRQSTIRARWIARLAGPSHLAIVRALEAFIPDVRVVEILGDDVEASDPLAVYRLAILVPEAVQADRQVRAQIAATLAPMAQGQLSWAIGRDDGTGEGDEIDGFYCDDRNSLCDIDLLDE